MDARSEMARNASLDARRRGRRLVVPLLRGSLDGKGNLHTRAVEFTPTSPFAARAAVPAKLHVLQYQVRHPYPAGTGGGEGGRVRLACAARSARSHSVCCSGVYPTPQVELAFAVTDYKVQGKTLDYFVLLLSPPLKPTGELDGRARPQLKLADLYVLLSRVRQGARLFVHGFDATNGVHVQWLHALHHPAEMWLWADGYGPDGRWDDARVRKLATNALCTQRSLARGRGDGGRGCGDGGRGRGRGHCMRVAATLQPPPSSALPTPPMEWLSAASATAVAADLTAAAFANQNPVPSPAQPPRPVQPLQQRYAVGPWTQQSCYVDAPLLIWEVIQRWLPNGPGNGLTLPPPEPFDHCVTNSRASAPINMTVDFATPLHGWWTCREGLRLGPPLDSEGLRAQQHALAGARDGVRRAYSITQVSSETREQAERSVRAKVTRKGSAAPVLYRLLSHPQTASRICRFGTQKRCRNCEHCNVWFGDPVVQVADADLREAGGDAFAAFVARCADRTTPVPACEGDTACSHRRRQAQAICSASGAAPADVVLLELPDALPHDRPYHLRPTEARELPLHGATYRLVGVLLYAHNYHYIADVHDPVDASWVRYDANANGGIGTPVAPPVGLTHHHGHVYYPIALAYVRVAPS